MYKNIKALVLRFTLEDQNCDIVTALYRPPESNVQDFLDNLNVLVEYADTIGYNLKFFADEININLVKEDSLTTAQLRLSPKLLTIDHIFNNFDFTLPIVLKTICF